MGRAHLAAAAGVCEVEVVALCDPLFDGEHGSAIDCEVLPFDDLISSPLIDAVLIAASTPAHEELVSSAISHGKHVLCEKPLTLNPESDRALELHAATRNRVLQIGFWRRFAEPYLRLRDILAQGHIGAVKAIRTAQWDAKVPSPAFCDPRASGGIEVDCGVHEFDLARWLLHAEVEAVTACSPAPSKELRAVADVETVFGLAQLSGDRIMTLDLTRTAGHHDSIRTELVGEHGTIVVDFAETGTIIVRSNDQLTMTDLAAKNIVADGLQAQLRAFSRAVRDGEPHRDAATALDSRYALVATQALRAARRDGTWHSVSA